MVERYVEAYNPTTGQTARRIDVTGKSERDIERTLRGMMINMHEDWLVRDSAWDDAALLPTGRGEK